MRDATVNLVVIAFTAPSTLPEHTRNTVRANGLGRHSGRTAGFHNFAYGKGLTININSDASDSITGIDNAINDRHITGFPPVIRLPINRFGGRNGNWIFRQLSIREIISNRLSCRISVYSDIIRIEATGEKGPFLDGLLDDDAIDHYPLLDVLEVRKHNEGTALSKSAEYVESRVIKRIIAYLSGAGGRRVDRFGPESRKVVLE